MASEDAPQSSQQTDSLLRRLAGPSVTKAGLALDQTEINRIIAEASRGSKFYENEKKKDRDLTERIEKLMKQKEEVLRGVNMHKIEASIDQLIEALEAERDLSQLIVHVDMDAFYANVELLHNPELKGKPFGVGRGVLTTASYDARKYGVRSGMAGFIAKKLCPDLIFVSNHFSLYSEMSAKVMAIFRRYDETMCPAGSDEAYLNITAYCEEHGITVEDCVSEMRQAVFDETKLTICSDKNKPNGQFKLDFEAQSVRAFMRDLSIRKVPGIGRVNERLLESIGIKTCGDIYTHRGLISLMDKEFGLRFLLRTYLGISSNVVRPYAREERKSIGAERTFQAIEDREKLLAKLEEVAEELERDMEQEGWVGRTVTLKYKLDTYQVFTRAKSFGRWVMKKEDLFNTGKELLLLEFPVKLRLIGLRVTKLKDLRAESSGATTGIKRFFEPVKHDDGGSPRKRRRVEPEDVLDEEAMPGFYENDDDPGDEHDDVDDADRSVLAPKPVSKGPATAKSRARSVSTAALLECPICGKGLKTDNQGLNAHIDFCLSRGAIWEAQGETIGAPRATSSGSSGGGGGGGEKSRKLQFKARGK